MRTEDVRTVAPKHLCSGRETEPRLQPFSPADKFYMASLGIAAATAVTGAVAPTAMAVGAAAAAGCKAGRIDARGLLALGAFGVGGAAHDAHAPNLPILAGLAAAATAFTLHKVPGFNNLCWLPPSRLRPNALPYRAFANGDKVLSGALLLCRLQQSVRPAVSVARALAGAAIGLGTVGALMGAGLASGFVGFDPRPPSAPVTALWALDNLLWVAASEEAVFRGLIQGGLAATLGGARAARAFSLLAASAAFGWVHLPNGGKHYAALAAVAGVGYGLVAQVTGRLEAAILAHFALNLTHFLCFTYPARDRRVG